MKKNIIIIFTGFIICTAFISPLQPVPDNRDACIGSYLCHRMCNSGHGANVTHSSDTISISITKDALDSVLNIKMGKQVLKFKLQNKTLQAYPKDEHYGGNLFAADSINFYVASGRAYSCRYLGKKK